MKKFVFRLQVVLDRAMRREEEEMRKLGALQQERARREQEIATTMAEQRNEQLALGQLQCECFDPHIVQSRYLYLIALAERIADLGTARDEVDQRIAAQREVLVTAMRERQALENLREQRYQEYLRETARVEQQTMEEAVLTRLAREQRTMPEAI